jgi:branched-chain amino acid transport system substrate-binding protein
MEKINKKWLVKIIVLVLVIIFVGLAFGMTRPVANKSVKVGVILPLTGAAADYGQATKKGIILAVAKTLKNDNINLEVIYEDSQADPKLAVSAMKKLVNIDKVKYVIGFTSGETLAICSIADTNKVILLGTATSPDITTKCGDYTFRNSPSDTYQGKVLADKVFAMGYKNVAIFYINNDYGVGLKDKFIKDFEGTITNVESHKPNDTDFRTQLMKIKANNPEAVVLISHLAEGSIILKQQVELGLAKPVFSSESLKDSAVFKLSKLSLERLYISFISQYEGPEFKEYKDSYTKAYGSEFGIYSDYQYDNILTIVNALKICKDGSDIECVKKEIYRTNIIGATGRINFDSNGDRVDKDYFLYKVQDNTFVPLD